MVRPRLFRHNVSLKLSPLEHAIVSYYSKKYRNSQNRIIRGMIKQFARADGAFDAKAFKRHVDREVIPEAEGDQALQDETKARVEAFLRELGGSYGARR